MYYIAGAGSLCTILCHAWPVAACNSQTWREASAWSTTSRLPLASCHPAKKIRRHSVIATASSWRQGTTEQSGQSSCRPSQNLSYSGSAFGCIYTSNNRDVLAFGESGRLKKFRSSSNGLQRSKAWIVSTPGLISRPAAHLTWSHYIGRVLNRLAPLHVRRSDDSLASASDSSRRRHSQRAGSGSRDGSHVHNYEDDGDGGHGGSGCRTHKHGGHVHDDGISRDGLEKEPNDMHNSTRCRTESHKHAHAHHSHEHDGHSHEHNDHSHDHHSHSHSNHNGDARAGSKHVHSHKDEHHNCINGHHHHHHHNHSHGGHSHSDPEDYNILQKAIVVVANLTRITALANALRESLPAACTSMGLCLMAAAVPAIMGPAAGAGIQSLLLAVAFPLTGVPALLDSAIDIAGGSVNIHVLMALAAFASFFLGNPLEGALLLAMFTLSHRAEEYFTERALRDLNSLRENSPMTALVVDPFDSTSPPPMSAMKYSEVPVADVAVGDLILVRAGETVAVDGEVSQGRSMITVEHLTGEAQPLAKSVGDEVPGGARTVDGMLIVRVKKAWDDSTVARIMLLTDDARARRPQLQRWLDLFSERYSQAVFAASLAVAVLGPVFGLPFFSTAEGVRGSLYRALGLMVAASPCALAVAPLAYAAAVSTCASQGILLRGGQALDALVECDTVAFDKTGTLTTGDLLCRSIDPIHGHACSDPLQTTSSLYVQCCSPNCADEALAVAAAMERAASHPIARAVLEHSEGKTLPAVEVHDFESVPGRGVKAVVTTLAGPQAAAEGELPPQNALLGSLDYITAESAAESRASISEAASAASRNIDLIQAALSIGRKVTLFHFEDRLRPHTAEVVSALRDDAGLRVLMLTGDRLASAQRVAAAVGIREFYAALKPEDKLNYVQLLARSDGKGGLVMVGDGINDAPALAAATVGVVLASRASATAAAAADVLLLRDALDGLPFLIAKARQTTAVVQQSVALALGAILIGVFPVLTGSLPLWLTVLLHEGGTLLVCLNSLRVFNRPMKISRPRTLQEKVAAFGRRFSTMTDSLTNEEPVSGATKLT